MTGRREALLARIRAGVEVDPETGCWVWTGADSGSGRGGGYARMSLDGQTVAVHRVAYVCTFGFVSSRRHIDHGCRNRRCVNPAHLELVTPRENARRRDAARAAR